MGKANQNCNAIPPPICIYINEKGQQVLARARRKRGPQSLLVGTQFGAAALENCGELPQNIKHTITMESGNPTSGCAPGRTGRRASKKCLYTRVPSGITHTT